MEKLRVGDVVKVIQATYIRNKVIGAVGKVIEVCPRNRMQTYGGTIIIPYYKLRFLSLKHKGREDSDLYDEFEEDELEKLLEKEALAYLI